MTAYQWKNESKRTKTANGITLLATPKSDFFCSSELANGALVPPIANAPFYYTELTGDFVLQTKVSLRFVDTYDSACIMVYENDRLWAKACLELTDFHTRAVVSVVTNGGASDDANGCNVETDTVWLQMARVGNAFALHYSLDGKRYDMMRLFSLPLPNTVKVGLLAQAPTGQGGDRHFEEITIQMKTIKNLRAGA